VIANQRHSAIFCAESCHAIGATGGKQSIVHFFAHASNNAVTKTLWQIKDAIFIAQQWAIPN